MIQKLNGRHGSTAVAPYRQSTRESSDAPDSWGMWVNRRFYSLEVVQQPIRARMCGFGDKDRRPLAPATVAKVVVRNDDDTLVDDDDIDCSFFLVTADLWSSDGTAERNLVLHPTSSDRYITAHAAKKRRPNPHVPPDLPPSSTAASPRPSRYPKLAGGDAQNQSAALAPEYVVDGYPYPHTQRTSDSDSITLHPAPSSYNALPDNAEWAYGVPAAGPSSYEPAPPSLATLMSPSDPGSATGEASGAPWHTATASAADDATYRSWGVTAAPYNALDNLASAATATSASFESAMGNVPSSPQSALPEYGSIELRDPHAPAWTQPGSPAPPAGTYAPTAGARPGTSAGMPAPALDTASAGMAAGPQNPPYGESMYASYGQPRVRDAATPAADPAGSPTTSNSIPPLPNHTYTRTLVGPLSANASRLLDEHRKPGVFFLFQDLSVRTEGSFRLRLRLMNVGAPPAPEPGAVQVHTTVSAVLAQTFTEPFDVYSAKRFPGVPDTTALSIALGNQGQKLPLRNRNGSRQQGRRRRRGDSDGSDESDGV